VSVGAQQPPPDEGTVAGPDEVARLVELVRAATERSAQLEHALQSRIVIEQAKGVLRERLGVPVDEAFELVRRAARNHRLRLRDLAARVVDEPETPAEIRELVRRRD
jgi:AmiR/NasT family two-component response regulator